MSESVGITRPGPILTDDNHYFWDAARESRLVAQRCGQCGRLRHPPRPMCPHCHSLDFEIMDLAGEGTIYSFSILHHPQNPAFKYPIIAVLVDLAEGVRLVSNLIDVDPADVVIGMPVVVDFVSTLNDGAIPVFKPNEANG